MSQTLAPRADVRRPALLATVPVGVMWVLEGIATMTFHALDAFGLRSWDIADLWGIFTAPWLHLGWGHLASNSVPLLVLGFLVALSGLRSWLVSALVIAVTSGMTAWLMSPPGTLTLGASGIVFGWLTYLLVRGFWTRSWKQVLIGMVVLAVYGSVLWGVLPTTPGVSWQGHLGGAIGGVIAAWLLHADRSQARRPASLRTGR